MKFRWKLLILLLSVAVIPPLVLRTFGSRHLRILQKKLVSQTRQCREQDAKARLRFVLESYSTMLRAELKQDETLLRIQAMEVERCLAQDPSSLSAGPAYFLKNKKEPLKDTATRQAFTILAGVKRQAVVADIARLAKMTPMYQKLSSPVFVRHQTLLTNGLFCIYPGNVSFPGDLDPQNQAWFRNALSKNPTLWSLGYADPVSGEVVVSASLPVKRLDGSTAGVTAIVLSVKRLFEKQRVFQNNPPQTRPFLVLLTSNPQTGHSGLEIITGYGTGDRGLKDKGFGSKKRWLTSGNKEQFQALAAGLRTFSTTVQWMPYQGQDSLWAASPIFYPYALVLITPREVIQKPAAETENFIQQLMDSQFHFSLVLLLATILAAILLAVWFSRTVTRPLRTLVQGVRHLSAGHYNTRVDIRSRDEFGDLGRIFDTMGPLLKEHVRTEHAMTLATEVQRNLLPQSDPQVPGLDVCGSCIFCEQVGGDYFDYLTIGEHKAGVFGVVIGDVTGHGISAALLMATTRALLHQRAAFPGCIACDLSDINRQLCLDVGDSGRFMTLFYAEFDTRAKTVRWVRAGHDPTIVYDPHLDSFDQLGGQGMAMGVFKNTAYAEYLREIIPGQIFVFGTDGLWETRNSKDELFGKDHLRKIIRAHAAESPKAIEDAVLQAVADHRGDRPQEDDVTLVIVKAVL